MLQRGPYTATGVCVAAAVHGVLPVLLTLPCRVLHPPALATVGRYGGTGMSCVGVPSVVIFSTLLPPTNTKLKLLCVLRVFKRLPAFATQATFSHTGHLSTTDDDIISFRRRFNLTS